MTNGGSARDAAAAAAAGKNTPAMQLKLPDVLLRLSVVPIAVTSLWLMPATTEDSNLFVANASVKALACVDAVAAAYSLASVLVIASFKPLATSNNLWLISVLDEAAILLMLMPGSATALLLMDTASNDGGRDASTLEEVCAGIERFRDGANVSLTVHGAALMCFAAIHHVSVVRADRKRRAFPVASAVLSALVLLSPFDHCKGC